MGRTSDGSRKRAEQDKERESLTTQLLQQRREPFADLLATILGAAPTSEALKDFAEAHPDRWGKLAETFSRLTGYADRSQTTHTHTLIDLTRMSDLELQQFIQAQAAANPLLGPALKQLTAQDAEYDIIPQD